MRASTALALAALSMAALLDTALGGRDYYEVLGVPRDSDSSVIKKEYRRLAKIYHPDKTGGDKKSEDKFKEISQAYEVLSDKRQRQIYDQFGEEGLQNNGQGGDHGGFDGFGGGGSGFQFTAGHGGGGFDMFEEAFGSSGGFEGFGNFGGFGGGQRFHQRKPKRKKMCFETKLCENGRCSMIRECTAAPS